MTDARPKTLQQWLDYAESSHPKNIDMGLERVREVAERMNLLEPRDVRYVIVAGTNGKGSTTTALAALLTQTGLKTGSTLSPHVHRFNERVQINCREVEDSALCLAFAQVDAAREDIPLTYFEFSTLVALECFRQAQVDVAVLEVGLGGRLDAFNIISADVAVITSIGLDHQDFLGDDIEQIGREKAGVFRSNQQVVLGTVTASVHAAAAELDCATQTLNIDFHVAEQAESWSYASPDLKLPELPRGVLAPTNVALAITAASALVDLDADQISRAILAARLTGRMERWSCDGRLILLDVAHNPDGARFLSGQLACCYPGMSFIGILGMLQGKLPVEVVSELPMVSRWLLTATDGPRARSGLELAEVLQGQSDVQVAEELAAAMELALSSAPAGSGILVAGSFSVVEQARNWLINSPVCVAHQTLSS
jgi:dihydrofolate synthase/folylpolyglutamate synthase